MQQGAKFTLSGALEGKGKQFTLSQANSLVSGKGKQNLPQDNNAIHTASAIYKSAR